MPTQWSKAQIRADAARWDAGVPVLERAWGPEDGALFRAELDRANDEYGHLHPAVAAAVEAVAFHQDPRFVKFMAALWHQRHPQP